MTQQAIPFDSEPFDAKTADLTPTFTAPETGTYTVTYTPKQSVSLTPEFQETLSEPLRRKIERLETEVAQLNQINRQLEVAWREEVQKREDAERQILALQRAT